jgi:maltokinase
MTVKDLQAARWFAGKDRPIARAAETGAAGGLRLVDVAYADGTTERYLVPDPALRWGPLLDALRTGPLTGDDGLRLELEAGPALAALLGDDRAERIPSTDQSNTLVLVGERLLVKAYRKLEPGVHPEAEVLAALDGTGAPVPRWAGTLRLTGGTVAEPTVVALLQEHVAGATSGWEAPIEAVAAHLRGEAKAPVAPYAAAGAAAATLHHALAQTLGVTRDPRAGARRRADARAVLDEVAPDVPDAATLAGRLDVLAAAGDAPVQRIHGDLHVAQLLFAPDRVVVVDFEGDPTAPLAARRAHDTPLRDLAALLRSIDHVGSAAARRAGHADPAPWIAAARAAALDAYGPAEPRLLHALEVASELRELRYARRVLPEWAYVAHAGLRRLLECAP